MHLLALLAVGLLEKWERRKVVIAAAVSQGSVLALEVEVESNEMVVE